MLLHDYTIYRPKGTKIQTRQDVRYVYHVISSTYNPEKKYNVDKRVCIGRMIDDEHMIPNDRFLQYYPGLIMSEVEPPAFSDTLKVGSFIMIRKVIQDLKLEELLYDIYGEKAELMINLICYMIVNETSTLQNYAKFMRDHFILGKYIRSDSYLSKFLSHGINESDIELFLEAWNKLNSDIEDIYIGYDSTNINTSVDGVSMAEFGHAKDNDDLPQINLSYAINQENAMPLFYELYNGSINDNAQCRYMVEKARSFGYRNVGFLVDKGYFSKMNVQYFDRNDFAFVIMVKENNKIVKEVVDKVKVRLKNMAGCYLAEHGVCGITEKARLYAEDKKDRYFHVYYDDVRASESRMALLQIYDKMEKEIQKKVEKKTAVEGELKKYKKAFKLKYDTNGYLKGYQRDDEYIQKELHEAGYFVIITSKEMNAGKALDIYRDRDSIEKLFRSLKTEIGYSKFGVHSEVSIKAKTHITFLANIVRNQIHQNLKGLVRENRKDFTVPSVLSELENIEVSRVSGGNYLRRYALTAKQKKMLKAFDIDEKYIDEEVQSLR